MHVPSAASALAALTALAQAEPAQPPHPLAGLLGVILLFAALVGWLAIACFFLFGLVPVVRKAFDPRTAGEVETRLLESYYVSGLLLQLLGLFGAITLAIGAHYQFVDPARATVWLSLVVLMMLISAVGQWGLLPRLRRCHREAHDAADVQTRQAAAARWRGTQHATAGLQAAQLLACLGALWLFIPERPLAVPTSAPAPDQPRVIFRTPPLSLPTPRASSAPARPASQPAPATQPATTAALAEELADLKGPGFIPATNPATGQPEMIPAPDWQKNERR